MTYNRVLRIRKWLSTYVVLESNQQTKDANGTLQPSLLPTEIAKGAHNLRQIISSEKGKALTWFYTLFLRHLEMSSFCWERETARESTDDNTIWIWRFRGLPGHLNVANWLSESVLVALELCREMSRTEDSAKAPCWQTQCLPQQSHQYTPAKLCPGPRRNTIARPSS